MPTFYVFTSGFARDVIYNVMLYKQRSVLHKQMAEIMRKYDDLLCNVNIQNSEVRNSLCRHEILSQFDGMNANSFEDEIKSQNDRMGFNLAKMNMNNHDGTQHHVVNPSDRMSMRSDFSFDDFDFLGDQDPNNQSLSLSRKVYFATLPSSVLVIYLVSAHNIPKLNQWIIPNLYITFHYGDGKEEQLSRSELSSNSDDNNDPIWDEYSSVSLSSELLLSAGPQKLIFKFWEYSELDISSRDSGDFSDDILIGKISINLNELYEEQIKQHRHLERKLLSRQSAAAADGRNSVYDQEINYNEGLIKKQLEDRDYIYVDKQLKIEIDEELQEYIPDNKHQSMLKAMFKFCVLPVVKQDFNENIQQKIQENNKNHNNIALEMGLSGIINSDELMDNLQNKFNIEEDDDDDDDEQYEQYDEEEEEEEKHQNNQENLQLFQNYSGNDSYFEPKLENDNSINMTDEYPL